MHNTFILDISGLLFFAYFILLIAIEKIFPLREQKYNFPHRLAINLGLALFMFVVALTVVRPVGLMTIAWANIHHFGLLALLPLDGAWKFSIGFLLMDLSFYYWHRLNHTLSFLWRFHVIHHIDPDLDVSTAVRFHFVEVLYSAVFRLLQLGLLGVNPLLFFSYEVIFQANTLLQHSNTRFPIHLERLINKILVTPRMHGIHHSQIKSEMNANYAVIFSFWDRIHQTLCLNIVQNMLVIGVPAYAKSKHNRFWQLLHQPFRHQANSWQDKTGKEYLTRTSPTSTLNKTQLAE